MLLLLFLLETNAYFSNMLQCNCCLKIASIYPQIPQHISIFNKDIQIILEDWPRGLPKDPKGFLHIMVSGCIRVSCPSYGNGINHLWGRESERNLRACYVWPCLTMAALATGKTPILCLSHHQSRDDPESTSLLQDEVLRVRDEIDYIQSLQVGGSLPA